MPTDRLQMLGGSKTIAMTLRRSLQQASAGPVSCLLFGWVLLSFAGGCAATYHAYSRTGGYTDTQLAPDRFRVVVVPGNSAMTYEQAFDFAMLRACELTLQAGFKYLALTEESLPRRDLVSAGVPYKELEIRCFTEKPAAVQVFDAVVQQQSLKQKYKIK